MWMKIIRVEWSYVLVHTSFRRERFHFTVQGVHVDRTIIQSDLLVLPVSEKSRSPSLVVNAQRIKHPSSANNWREDSATKITLCSSWHIRCYKQKFAHFSLFPPPWYLHHIVWPLIWASREGQHPSNAMLHFILLEPSFRTDHFLKGGKTKRKRIFPRDMLE